VLRPHPEPRLFQVVDLPLAVPAKLGVHDLVVQFQYRVEQHLRARRAAGQVDVHRHDVVDALHDRVIVEHAAAGGANTHRDDPFGVGHLVVDLPEHRRHLLADPARHDHQVRLPRGVPRDFHPEPGQVVFRPAGHHQLHGAAGQPEGGGPALRMSTPVVYDACVLYGNELRDLLIRIAISGMVRAHWTDEILDETFGNLVANRSDLSPERLMVTRERMNVAVPGALVSGYEILVETLKLPDPGDRHVLAAAIAAGGSGHSDQQPGRFPCRDTRTAWNRGEDSG
jgi:hypothetical protein